MPAEDPLTAAVLVPQISDVEKISRFYDAELGGLCWLLLKSDGTVWISTDLSSFSQVQALDRVTSIEQNIALKEDGTVWSLHAPASAASSITAVGTNRSKTSP